MRRWFNSWTDRSPSGCNTTQQEEGKFLQMLMTLTSLEDYNYALTLIQTQPDSKETINNILHRRADAVDVMHKWISLLQSLASSLQHEAVGMPSFPEGAIGGSHWSSGHGGPLSPAAVVKPVKAFLLVTAQTYGTHEQILRQLKAQGSSVTPTDDPQQCDVILLFCPILSRIGSDVDAAVRQIPVEDKPVVLVLMHHTYDPDQYLDKTRWSEQYPCIKQEVRVLFHKSQNGLLQCPRNQEAVRTLWSICDQY